MKPGLVNVDFADVRTIMGNAGAFTIVDVFELVRLYDVCFNQELCLDRASCPVFFPLPLQFVIYSHFFLFPIT